MKRRHAIQTIIGVPAAAALAPAIAQEQKPKEETPKTATTTPDAVGEGVVRTFASGQFAALRRLSDILSLGALEAEAPEFLDFLIGQSDANRQTLYRNGLDRLNADAQQRYGKPFAQVTPAEAAPILAPLREPWTYHGPTDAFA